MLLIHKGITQLEIGYEHILVVNIVCLFKNQENEEEI